MRRAEILVIAMFMSLGSCQVAAAERVVPHIQGHMLTLSFPATTLRETVSLKLDDRDVPRRLSAGRHPAVYWSAGADLVVDLHRVKRAIGIRWAKTAWIWGQTRDGQALLQSVDLPGRDRPGRP